MDPWTYINISPTGDKKNIRLYGDLAENQGIEKNLIK